MHFISPQTADRSFWVGVMSGTSLDGVDAVALQWQPASTRWVTLAWTHVDLPQGLQQRLLALNASSSPPDGGELHQAMLAANEVAQQYACAVHQLLQQAAVQGLQPLAIGAHGQTVRHMPPSALQQRASLSEPWPYYSLQLINPSLLAELTGITVVADFRNRDVAAGGQGAPLVPAFHQALFQSHSATRQAIINIGGMANVTCLQPNAPALGYDTGPGNVLMDAWCMRHNGQAFDDGGRWAASGQVQPDLLNRWMADPFFHQQGPKSTGRERFSNHWFATELTDAEMWRPEDVQASLCALTAWSIHHQLPASVDACWVCGGGALNTELLRQLQALRPTTPMRSTAEMGMHPLTIEAAAFAWLAAQTLEGLPGNLTTATGACGPRVLGGIYPA